MISEGTFDSEDWSNTGKNESFFQILKYIKKKTVNLNCNEMS